MIGRSGGQPTSADMLEGLPAPAQDLLKDPPVADKQRQKSVEQSGRGSLSEPRDSKTKLAATEAASTKLETIYAECARFVWLTLQRLGVRQADLDDVCHDVFVIVQRKLPEFRHGARLQPWLLAICARTAANYRRRAHVRLEHASGGLSGEEDVVAMAPELARPDHELSRRRALELAEAILSKMTPVKRAVFVMFEVEGMACQEIASELGLPVGTVYSRLHSARSFFQENAARSTTPTRRDQT